MEQQRISADPAAPAFPGRASTALRSLNTGQRVRDTGPTSAAGVERGTLVCTPRELPAASLLFAPGYRPCADQVRDLAAVDRGFLVSHDPEEGACSGASEPAERWLELMAHGLAFDLVGLAPGEPARLPQASHHFGLPGDFAQRRLEAMTLIPGPHLGGARHLLPVLRSHALLAARLAALPGVAAIAWHPARAWSAPHFFRTNVLRWIEGGAFPGLGLASLSAMSDGGMISKGLALFIGQEVLLAPSVADNRAAGARIALRVMHWLVEHGAIERRELLTGPGGELLGLEPSADRTLITVSTT